MDEWDPTELQGILNEFMDRRGLSQNQLAQLVGVSQTAVNRWMQPRDSTSPAGNTQPHPPQIRKLAKTLGIPHNTLMLVCGHLDPEPKSRRHPAGLVTLQSDVESWYYTTEAPKRDQDETVIRAVIGQHREPRPNRRRKPSPPDEPTLLVSYLRLAAS